MDSFGPFCWGFITVLPQCSALEISKNGSLAEPSLRKKHLEHGRTLILENKYSTSALEKDYGLFWLRDLGEFTACSAVANPKGVLVWRCDYWNTKHPFWLQSSSIQQRLAGWLTAVLIVLPCASQIEAGNTGNCVNAGNGKVLWPRTSRI